MRTYFLIAAALMMTLTGCAKLEHLDQLLIIKDYSASKDLQRKEVNTQNKNFEKLLASLQEGNFSQRFSNKKKIKEEFGAPVISRGEERNGKEYEVWLYRYPTRYNDSPKVYFYFDQEGQLKDLVQYQAP